jgi:sugar transferase (PEP-CTERM/EpsH1 system associated)
MVDHYVALSKDLKRYLQEGVGIPQNRITQIYNGVDTELFHPAYNGREPLPAHDSVPADFASPDAFVIGTVGRMQPVKDQLTLARAFVLLLQMAPQARQRLRLVLVGDGPLRNEVAEALDRGGAGKLAWLAGARDDVSQLMRTLDLFVLPSLAEGVSNTILEAMASGLPVVATAVGGNPELVEEGRTGTLVPRCDPQAMAQAMLRYYADASECRRQGREARLSAERLFSIGTMVSSYVSVYDRLLAQRQGERNQQSCVES